MEGTSTHSADAAKLLRGRWHHLRKLALGGIEFEWVTSTTGVKRPFIDFLEAHPVLETLKLSRHSCHAIDLESLDPAAIPKVTEFAGTLEQLRALPQIHASLNTLTFRDSMRTHGSTPLAVAGVLEGLKSLTHLHISFIFHSTYDSNSFLRSLGLCSPRLCHLDLICAHKPSFYLVCVLSLLHPAFTHLSSLRHRSRRPFTILRSLNPFHSQLSSLLVKTPSLQEPRPSLGPILDSRIFRSNFFPVLETYRCPSRCHCLVHSYLHK
jgi:hypothetical protein